MSLETDATLAHQFYLPTGKYTEDGSPLSRSIYRSVSWRIFMTGAWPSDRVDQPDFAGGRGCGW